MAATNIQTFAGQVEVTSNLTVDTNTLHVDSVAGRVGIGKTDPAYAMDVNGTMNATALYVGGSEFTSGFDPDVAKIAIGTNAGATTQGNNAVAVGYAAGQYNQKDYAIAVGRTAGQYVQGTQAVAVGNNAGNTQQGVAATALGYYAGLTSQGTYATAVGYLAGQTSQGTQAVAVGRHTGKSNQGSSSVAVGYLAGEFNQGTESVAIGKEAAGSNQGSSSVAMGREVATYNQGDYATAVGNRAGNTSQGNYTVAVGYLAGAAFQDTYATALGNEAGYTNQAQQATAVGNSAGRCNQSSYATAVGNQAGQSYQGISTTAVGHYAGNTSQGNNAVAVGDRAGNTTQGASAVAVGPTAGNTTQGSRAVAVGVEAGRYNQGYETVAVGYRAGQTAQGALATAVGRWAGQTSQDAYAVAIGISAGETSQGIYAVAVGNGAGKSNQRSSSVAVGMDAGRSNQGLHCVAMGRDAGRANQGNYTVAVGREAGQCNQRLAAIAVGYRAAQCYQQDYATAVGYEAGQYNQGIYAIALGRGAARFNQPGDSFYTRYQAVRGLSGTRYAMYINTAGEIQKNTSDDRLKHDEKYITGAVKSLCKLRPQEYLKRQKLDETDKEQSWTYEAGLMAQEVYYSAPELRHVVMVPPEAGDIDNYTPPPSDDPTQDPDYSVWGNDFSTIDYNQLTPYLVKAVQEIVTELPRSKTTVSNVWGQNITGLVVSANANAHKTNATPIVTLSNVYMDKKWYGVVSNKTTDTNDYDTLVDMKGDTQIWVTDAGGPLESGDLVTTSNVAPGYAQKQGDDLLRSSTVAKVTQDCDFTEPAQRAIRVPKRELSNVTYYTYDASYEIDLEKYERVPTFKTRVDETTIYFQEVTENSNIFSETRYYQGDTEVSENKYDTLPEESRSIKHLSEISVDDYEALDDEAKATYSVGIKKRYFLLNYSMSKTQIPQHDEEVVVEELVDVLDENGQIVWEETANTVPVYTLVDHGSYKAALVSAKLV